MAGLPPPTGGSSSAGGRAVGRETGLIGATEWGTDRAAATRAPARGVREERAVHITVNNEAPTRPALPLPGAHQGLVGLRQRAELFGGTLSHGPTAEGGYELRLAIPTPGTWDTG